MGLESSIPSDLGCSVMQQYADFCFSQLREMSSHSFASDMLFASTNPTNFGADGTTDKVLCELLTTDPVFLTELSPERRAAATMI